MTDDSEDIDLGEALGASDATSTQMLTLYIPNKDRDGNEFGSQRRWVLKAADLLAQIGGGVTVMPACEGGWLNEATAQVIWEAPVVVYTYIKPEPFLKGLPKLRTFLHRLGRETNQGEIAVEFDGNFYRITTFDAEGAAP
ncbi:MAG: hypothetical protein HY898_22925 [Deltaproteobacteria bacterium]|nr:hypothetical protein [Deltaproteobacteria bacterium]